MSSEVLEQRILQ
jgi:hypothetical protein